jgi:hypothetical protein
MVQSRPDLDELRARDHGLVDDLRLTVSARVPKPDPRKPIAPAKYLLWKYNGTDASPALHHRSAAFTRVIR